jgi:LCP family protein required for cell wall assembly
MLSGQSAWYQPSPSPYMPLPQVGQGPGLKPPQRKKKRRIPVWALVILSLVLVLLVAGGSVGGYYYFTLSAPISGIVNQQVPRLKGDDDPNQGRGNGGSILSGGRINILLLGSDTDEKFNNTYLAQSDIVVTVDPATKQVGMLSIPRDFWINVPGSGMHKLDEAYALGGVALSRLTITEDFGIHINYYAWVGLDGFVKVINTVNGVDVDVIHPITDDNYPYDVGNHTNDIYAYQRLYLPPGPQHLTGAQALEYVRSRHADLVGDFGRSARQQQILTQLKNKLNNPGIIEQLPALANDLAGVVKTDMQLNQVFDLMRFARNINTNTIQRVTLGPPYSSTGTAPDGQSVVFPHCDLIVPEIAKMFGSTANATCNITADGSNNASPLASTSQGSPVSNAITQATTNNMVQTASQMASISTMSLNGNNSDLLGIHSLLDLLFLVAFESPDALQT